MDREDFLKWLFVIVLVVAGGLYIYFRPNTGVVSIRNMTRYTITQGELEVCGQKFDFSNLSTGRILDFHYTVKKASTYTVTVKFYDNVGFTSHVGNVAARKDAQDALEITSTGVTFALP